MLPATIERPARSVQPTRRRSPEVGRHSGPDKALLQRVQILEDRPIEFIGSAASNDVEAGVAALKLPDFFEQLGESSWLEAEQEAVLFRCMNQYKRRAAQSLHSLDRGAVQEAEVARIETWLRQAESIRNRLACVYLKLAISVAKAVGGAGGALDDLVSEASVTLLRAIEKFDADRGFRFSTYATHAIRRGLWRRINRSRKESSHCASSEALESVADERRWTWERERRAGKVLKRLDAMMNLLSDRDRDIVLSRYGLGDELQPQTLQQLADRFGVSRERIRQLESRALCKLRSMAGDKERFSLEA